MFQPIKKLFKPKDIDQVQLLNADVQLATARLMLEVVIADGHVERGGVDYHDRDIAPPIRSKPTRNKHIIFSNI